MHEPIEPEANRTDATAPLQPLSDTAPEARSRITGAQWWLISLIVAFMAGSALYRFLIDRHMGQSSAMFLGIPAVLAILLALTPGAKSLTGGILKGITLALLVVAPLVGEGYVCILFASPLFYLVGAVVGVVLDSLRKADRKTTVGCIAILLAPMCLEGVSPQFAFNRSEAVEAVAVVDAPVSAVTAVLAQSPAINAPLPTFLRIGFPRPLAAHGEGLSLGSTRTIHFAGAEGDPPGDLILRITERKASYVRFETVSDTTKLTQWLRWQSSEVSWRAIDPQHTTVTWRIQFDRQLDPAWYFAPWERTAVHEAARYLIAATATPHPVTR